MTGEAVVKEGMTEEVVATAEVVATEGREETNFPVGSRQLMQG